MTKTQYYTATSVDGFIADADNSLEWLFAVEREGPGRFNEFFAGVGAMCMGATTYKWMVAHDPASWRQYYGDTPVGRRLSLVGTPNKMADQALTSAAARPSPAAA